MSKRLPNSWQEVILVSHCVMIKFNSDLVNFKKNIFDFLIKKYLMNALP